MSVNRKAVSTVITSIMLLSLAIALTAGTYMVTTRTVDTVSPTAKAAFEKGEAISGDFAAAIEEGGLGTTPVVPEGYEYGDLADLEVSIQKSPIYVKDIPGYFRVILENPTSKVIKVPELEIFMKDANDQAVDLSKSEFTDIEIADRWGDANPIGFTPSAAGGYEIEIKIQDDAEVAHLEVVSMEVASSPEAERDTPPNAGKVTFSVTTLSTDALKPCLGTAVTECKNKTENRQQRGSVDNTIDHGTKKVTIGSVSSCPDCKVRGLGLSFPGSGICNQVTKTEVQEVYSNNQGRYLKAYTACGATHYLRAVGWDTQGVTASFGGGGSCTYSCGTGGEFVNIAITSFNSQNKNLMQLAGDLLDLCGVSKFEMGYALAGNLCTCLETKKTAPDGASYVMPTGESLVLEPNEPTCIKDETRLYSPIGSDIFYLPNERINTATLYVRPRDTIAVKIKVNDEVLTDTWLQLTQKSPVTLDVTDIVAPGGIENSIYIWIDPKVGEGEYVLDWTVLTE